MEKINTETAAAPAATEEVKVIIITGDGPAPEALRKAFPNAKFIDTSEPADPTPTTEEPEALAKLRATIIDAMVKMAVDTPTNPTPEQVEAAIRPVAHVKFKSVAEGYGLGFTEEEHEALLQLSRAFCPAVAVEAAHVTCRAFLGDWRR